MEGTMQPKIAKQFLKSLRRREGWTDGRVVRLRAGVSGIEITAPDGERCSFSTLDDVRLKVKLLSAQS
jgi:hypothetical protein